MKTCSNFNHDFLSNGGNPNDLKTCSNFNHDFLSNGGNPSDFKICSNFNHDFLSNGGNPSDFKTCSNFNHDFLSRESNHGLWNHNILKVHWWIFEYEWRNRTCNVLGSKMQLNHRGTRIQHVLSRYLLMYYLLQMNLSYNNLL